MPSALRTNALIVNIFRRLYGRFAQFNFALVVTPIVAATITPTPLMADTSATLFGTTEFFASRPKISQKYRNNYNYGRPEQKRHQAFGS